MHQPQRDPTTAQSARACTCHWFNWFPVGDVTSDRHTGAVGLAHVLLNRHEAPRARSSPGACHPLSWGSPAPGRPGPVRSPLRNANPLRGQVRSALPRPPHPAATATAATCPSPLVLSPSCSVPSRCPRPEHAQTTSHLPQGDHGSISARLAPTWGCCVPCAPPDSAGTPCAVEGAGG